jgi:hypothetical protein
MILLLLTLLAAEQPSFAEKAKQVKVGVTQAKVRSLLGAPEKPDEKVWHYKDPPNRPDGPYTWYRFTFEKGKVSKVESGGVACVLNE